MRWLILMFCLFVFDVLSEERVLYPVGEKCSKTSCSKVRRTNQWLNVSVKL